MTFQKNHSGISDGAFQGFFPESNDRNMVIVKLTECKEHLLECGTWILHQNLTLIFLLVLQCLEVAFVNSTIPVGIIVISVRIQREI